MHQSQTPPSAVPARNETADVLSFSGRARSPRTIRHLIVLMVFVAFGTTGLLTWSLYRTALDSERQRLVEVCDTNAELIAAVARFDADHTGARNPDQGVQDTLSQVLEGQQQYEEHTGRTELVFARRAGDTIRFLGKPRFHQGDQSLELPFDGPLAEPTRRALSGESNVILGRDYRDVPVLAAFRPIAPLNIAIVAKADLSAIRGPFIRAGLLAGGAGLIVLVIGIFAFLKLSDPLLRLVDVSEQRYRDLVEAMQEGLAVLDRDGRIVYVNDGFCRMLVSRPDEILGRSLDELGIVGAGTANTSVADPDRRDQDEVGSWRLDFVRGDGQHAAAVTSSRALFDGAGASSGSFIIMTDVTELRRVHSEIESLNESLESRVRARTRELQEAQTELLTAERLATLGRLTATVGHELRNPLGVVRNSTRVLTQVRGDCSDIEMRALERIDRSVRRCDHIIEELHEYSRTRPLQTKTIAFDSWLAQLIDDNEVPEAVVVETDLGCAGCYIRMDEDRVRRVIINFVDNACHAMRSKPAVASSARGRILLQTRADGDDLVVSIHDDGPGIAADVQQRIFEPLFSTKAFGTGLGLAIVQQLVEQHGGQVDLDTTAVHGTRFVMRLPGLISAEVAESSANPPPSGS